MAAKNPSSDRGADTEKTPLLLDGVSLEDLTKEFLREIHRAADEEGIPLENISVQTGT